MRTTPLLIAAFATGLAMIVSGAREASAGDFPIHERGTRLAFLDVIKHHPEWTISMAEGTAAASAGLALDYTMGPFSPASEVISLKGQVPGYTQLATLPPLGVFHIPFSETIADVQTREQEAQIPYSDTIGLHCGAPIGLLADVTAATCRAVDAPDKWSCGISDSTQELPPGWEQWNRRMVGDITVDLQRYPLLDANEEMRMVCNYNHFDSNPAFVSGDFDAHIAYQLISAWRDEIITQIKANRVSGTLVGPKYACNAATWTLYMKRLAYSLHFVEDMATDHHKVGNSFCSRDSATWAPSEFGMIYSAFDWAGMRTCHGFLYQVDLNAIILGNDPADFSVTCDESLKSNVVGLTAGCLAGASAAVKILVEDGPIGQVDAFAGYDTAEAVAALCMGLERLTSHHCQIYPLPSAPNWLKALKNTNKGPVVGHPSHRCTSDVSYGEAELCAGTGADYEAAYVAAASPVIDAAIQAWSDACKEPDRPCVDAQCDKFCKATGGYSDLADADGNVNTNPGWRAYSPQIGGRCVDPVGSLNDRCRRLECRCFDPAGPNGPTPGFGGLDMPAVPAGVPMPDCADPSASLDARTGRCGEPCGTVGKQCCLPATGPGKVDIDGQGTCMDGSICNNATMCNTCCKPIDCVAARAQGLFGAGIPDGCGGAIDCAGCDTLAAPLSLTVPQAPSPPAMLPAGDDPLGVVGVDPLQPNHCCNSSSCAWLGYECGMYNTCGQTVWCGVQPGATPQAQGGECPDALGLPDSTQTCNHATHKCMPSGCVPKTCGPGDAGFVPDGCGGTLSCGCDASSCPSGCCVGGACAGSSDFTCGASGSACVDCTTTGSHCVGGACVAGCDAATCPGGCCAGGVCLPLSDATCGPPGSACTDCSQLGLACNSSGVCIATCDASTCASGCCNSAGHCALGIIDAECGQLGGLCTDCSAFGMKCSAQSCHPASPCGGYEQPCCEVSGQPPCSGPTPGGCTNCGCMFGTGPQGTIGLCSQCYSNPALHAACNNDPLP
jgi:hypothetical protein